MYATDHDRQRTSLRILSYLFAGLLAIILCIGFVELARYEQSRREKPLAGALRAGTLEFDKHHERIVIGQPQATVVSHTESGLALVLTATMRNDTGRVIKGLEVRGTVVDCNGSPVSERIAIIIPTQQTAIEPNEEINARLLLEGVRPEVSHASFRMEVTGLTFD